MSMTVTHMILLLCLLMDLTVLRLVMMNLLALKFVGQIVLDGVATIRRPTIHQRQLALLVALIEHPKQIMSRRLRTRGPRWRRWFRQEV